MHHIIKGIQRNKTTKLFIYYYSVQSIDYSHILLSKLITFKYMINDVILL